MSDLSTALTKGLHELGLTLDDSAHQKLLDYVALLQKWNKVYNLSAIRDPQEMLVKHLFDSLAVAPYIQAERIIDVGTGGGLPGIPLAIVYPQMQVDLLDSNEKKTRFLVQAKAQLGLDNVQVLHKRVEDHNESYDGVISRAFTALDNFAVLTEHLLTEQGVWWAMKSQNLPQEIKALPSWIKVDQVIDLQVPGLVAKRVLVAMHKQGEALNG